MGLLEILVMPLGWILRGKRTGEQSAYQNYSQLSTSRLFELSSPAFQNGGKIPKRYAGIGLGENISPELIWTKPPENTKLFLLVMEDIDSPFRKPNVHVTALFEPTIGKLNEGALTPDNTEITFIPGRKGRLGYYGPRPLPGHGKHRYWFHLYALDEVILTDRNYSNLEDLLPLVEEHVIARADLEGTHMG